MGVKTRIILFVMFFGIVAGGSITMFNQLMLERSLLDIQERQVKTSFDLGTLNIDTIIEGMETAALTLAHFSAEIYQLKQSNPNIDTDRVFKTNLFNTFAIVEHSIGGGIWFEPFVLEQDIRWYGPYVYRDQGELKYTWELSTEAYDYHSHDWYKQVFVAGNLNENGVYWSEPYYDDAGTNALMVTVSAPIYDTNDKMVGVTTVDWAIKHLRDELLNIEFTENSSAFLIDRDSGLFLSFPDSPEDLFKSAGSYSWGAELLKESSFQNIKKIEQAEYKGQIGTIFHITENTNLILGIFIPDGDYLQFVNEVTAKNLKFSFLMSLFFLCVLIVLLNKLFAPFAKLMKAIQDSIFIDEKNNRVSVTPLAKTSVKEFNSITKALNQVYEHINQHASYLRKTNQDLRDKQIQINELNNNLEDKVSARTTELESKTEELIDALESLQDAQTQMILMEKNAALGQLIAGVAHEVNTPIGVCVTATSVLQQSYQEFVSCLEQEKVTRNQLNRFIAKVDNTLELLLTNLARTNKLIESFKQVSIDQSTESLREIELASYLTMALEPVVPITRRNGVKLTLTIDAGIRIITYPGVLVQVVSNLIMNSVQHAFPNMTDKQIELYATLSEQGNELILEYRDNGIGMSKEVRDKVFEPFFTTKRGEGGVGLGMHITFNLVNHKLKGRILLESEVNRGVNVDITLPIILVDKAANSD